DKKKKGDLTQTFEQGIDKNEKAVSGQVAKVAKVGQKTVAKVKFIEKMATPEQKKKLEAGNATVNQVYSQLAKEAF
ncbi:hypothetical protein ACFLVE_04405, partial [Chloroflexota bacterium]